MKRTRTAMAVLSVAALGVIAIPSPQASSSGENPTDGGDPDGYAIAQQPYSAVYEGAPGVIAGNAFVETFDTIDRNNLPTKHVLMTWQENEDIATVDNLAAMIHSDDRGYTFPSGIDRNSGSGFYTKLRDGAILMVEFIPAKVIDSHTVELVSRRSTDNGKTWKREAAMFTTDQTFNPARFDRGMRAHRDIFYALDGSLLMGYYTAYQQDSGHRAEIARSIDNGKTWKRYATVGPPTSDGYQYNETGIARAVNGDLVAVMRTYKLGGLALTELRTARSTDDGKTWSTPVPAKITTASGEPAPTTGVMPTLRMLPNGIMTMTWGRPDNWIAISPDGLGNSWEKAQVTYRNYPRVVSSFQRSHGSSGNGAHAVVAANRVLQVGDNCAPSWGCPETDSGFHTDGEYRVWKKFIDIVGPGTGKIDLLGKYAKKKVTIDTTMTSTNPKLPEMSPLGAIDGSTEWASSAVRKDREVPATYTLTLDRTYTLTRAGLSLHPGQPSAAKVEASVDGTTWTTVVDTGQITSHALEYFDIDKVRAKQVRVTVNDPSSNGAAFLNEVELYSTVDSFENDPVNQVPRGYTDAVGVTVTDFDVDDSRHVMRLADAWSDRIAQATRVSAAAPKQTLEFRVNSIGYARSFGFTTRGDTASAHGLPAYQMNVGSDGSIGWYDGTAKKWNKLTPAGTVPQKEWHTIRVEATLTGAEVFLDGAPVGSAPPTTPGITALTGHQFASSGTASFYDHFLIDDVEQTNPA
ncbi:discoidin domain-containing protein [Micromonospora sp. DR5-3]|uniref:discoidin domain-containing protein n=1 Tax=unclassified Micromonospora TaxID=2617518 RepID=UPI0011D58A78|nr:MULTISPECIES: discoidin domain-containing protein [unclassified Micromonospora]MCW3818921.1 discoidin domain-containing protein [Micromonospora sp. DR5-3]TYC20945.1 hypothetical protein FXF52_28645 [Micromonospora sp. MP36]